LLNQTQCHNAHTRDKRRNEKIQCTKHTIDRKQADESITLLEKTDTTTIMAYIAAIHMVN